MPKNITLRFREADRDAFDNIRTGKKSIETRAATVKYHNTASGDTLTFVCGSDRFQKTITNVHHWPSIAAMLKDVPLKSVMPNVNTPEEMEAAYHGWPGYAEKIREHGLIGFEMA